VLITSEVNDSLDDWTVASPMWAFTLNTFAPSDSSTSVDEEALDPTSNNTTYRRG
jgi:hypothetical protein